MVCNEAIIQIYPSYVKKDSMLSERVDWEQSLLCTLVEYDECISFAIRLEIEERLRDSS